MFKTPKFWTQKNVISIAFLPLSFLYFIGFYLVHFFTKPVKISKKVICVGNLIAGGSGKTPTALAIGKILYEIDKYFVYLSRGYMGDGSTFLMLRKEDNLKAERVGDEPMLLIEMAPTFIAEKRLFGAQQIDKMSKFETIVMDDGMQNNSLYRDFTIMVIDGKVGFGNGFLIPAGPMRETLKTGLKKTDLIVLIGDAEEKLLKKLPAEKIVKAKVVPINIDQFYGKKLIAFCGLAYPKKFFSFLDKQGLDVIDAQAFSDHYLYKNNDLEKLEKIAAEKNATLITTKKDWVKFSPSFQKKISFLDIELEFENKEFVKNKLKKIYES
jgi:tetraacyldisaccharide 4'-kinase